MTDIERRILILALVSRKGENPDLWGYARLRKSILLLQKEEGVPLGFTFDLERERPVSPELQLFLEKMMYEDNLRVENTPSGFRRVIGEHGLALLRENPDIISRYEEQINSIFEKIRRMSLTDLRVAAWNAYLAHPE